MELSQKLQLAGVVATLTAVVVALLKEEIVKLWRRPDLHVHARLGPPDSHKTKFVVEGPRQGDCYYLRLLVKNEGTLRAEKVQVFAAKLFKHREGAGFEEVKSFLPMNLLWAHGQQKPGGPEIFAEGISPGMEKHCDFGCIYDPKFVHAGKFGGPPGQTVLKLDLEVFPFTNSNVLLPGLYRLALRVAGSNAPPSDATVEFRLSGAWEDDEASMFSRQVGFRIVD